MKRSIIYKVFGIAALAFAAFGAISCTEKETEVKEQPNFPEKVTINDIVPGTKLAVTFTPNMDWTLSLSDESNRWFEIDDKFDKQSISGEASRLTKRVSILTTSEESFSLRSCEVYLTMGGETKPIASFTLQAKNRALDVYPAIYSDNGFSFSDGTYVYDTKAMTSDDVVELVWDEIENKFIFPIKVKSNFDWTATWPKWARADINAETRIGDVPIVLYGIDSKLPYDAMEGVVTFKNGDEPFVSFKIKIPGIWDKFEANIGGASSLTFDHAAYYRADAGTFSKDPVEGSIYGPKESRVEVLELTESGYVQAQQDTWLKVDVSSWDNVAGAAVLQNRNISVSVARYTENKDRNAMILLLPATFNTTDIAEFFTDGMSQIKPEYAKYAVPVTQLARPTEYFTFESDVEDREFAGLFFGRAESDLLPQKNFTYAAGAETWQYDLTYNKTMASTKSAVNLTEPYETVEVYGADGVKISADSLSQGHWLNYEQLGDVIYGQIVMIEENLPRVDAVDKDGKPVLGDDGKPVKVTVDEIDGYVVFKNDQNEVLSIVHCFYIKEVSTPEDVLVDVSDKMFVNPAAAEAAGAKIYQIVSGPTYEDNAEFQAPVYLVRYTKDNTSLEVYTSVECTMYTCYLHDKIEKDPVFLGDGPQMVTIDDQMYKDKELYDLIEKYNAGLIDKYPDVNTERSTYGNLLFGKTCFEDREYPGYSKFNMKMPAGTTEKTKREKILFQSSAATFFIFYCELILP